MPFLMKDVHWSFMPRVPGTHTFLETNVRTYVSHGGKDPGVWFFSLDAANRLAVTTARLAFSLPYHFAKLSLDEHPGCLHYRGERSGASYDVETQLGPPQKAPVPGTLEFFLVERYLLYAYRRGHLLSGRVHHTPYPLREAPEGTETETLVQAAGITPRSFVHRAFSDGVDVEVFPLRALD